jgi:hypothetical protein
MKDRDAEEPRERGDRPERRESERERENGAPAGEEPRKGELEPRLKTETDSI